MLLFLSGVLTMWLQCDAMWPKILDGKNIYSSIDTVDSSQISLG